MEAEERLDTLGRVVAELGTLQTRALVAVVGDADPVEMPSIPTTAGPEGAPVPLMAPPHPSPAATATTSASSESGAGGVLEHQAAAPPEPASAHDDAKQSESPASGVAAAPMPLTVELLAASPATAAAATPEGAAAVPAGPSSPSRLQGTNATKQDEPEAPAESKHDRADSPSEGETSGHAPRATPAPTSPSPNSSAPRALELEHSTGGASRTVHVLGAPTAGSTTPGSKGVVQVTHKPLPRSSVTPKRLPPGARFVRGPPRGAPVGPASRTTTDHRDSSSSSSSSSGGGQRASARVDDVCGGTSDSTPTALPKHSKPKPAVRPSTVRV